MDWPKINEMWPTGHTCIDFIFYLILLCAIRVGVDISFFNFVIVDVSCGTIYRD
jgi:hypothetical protein